MTGIVTLSFELELGWGMHDMNTFSHLSDDRTSEETALSRILNSFERNNIRASFNVVGHLFHESCPGEHSGPYPAPWWRNDPGSSHRGNPQFYAPELIENIIESSVDHEICTHTYSHILAEEVSAKLLRHELDMVHDLHQRWGLSLPKSIVMPRHQKCDYSVLSEYGISTIRRPIRGYGKPNINPISKLWWLLTRNHPKCEIKDNDEIIETTCTPHPSLSSTILSTGREKPEPYFRVIPRKVREYLHKKYLIDAINLAAYNGHHIHLWTHLYNIANKSQWDVISPVLDYIGEMERQEKIKTVPMRDLPMFVE